MRHHRDDIAAPLARELALQTWTPAWGQPIIGNFDPRRVCEHRPDQTYTRAPCSCGRELWPPRGRGRGESLNSPRRQRAQMKAIQATELYTQGWSYAAIARKLGYADTSGAWRAVQRLRDKEAAWDNYERRTGHRLYSRHQPTAHELEAAIAYLEAEIHARRTHTTPDDVRVQKAKLRLVRDTLTDIKRQQQRKQRR